MVAVERLRTRPDAEGMEAPGLGDEHLLHRVVVAAAAGEAGRVPGVVDLHLLHRQPDDAELGEVVGAGHRRAVREEDAAADEAIGVQAAAAELPAAADPEAALDPMRLADRRQPARREQVHVGIELARHRLLDACRVVAAVGADHRHPRRRRVVVGEDLHQLALLQDVHLGTAPLAGKGDAEDAGAPHRLDQVGRQAPVARDVVGGRFDRGAERAGVGEDGFTVEDGRGVGRHAYLRERLARRRQQPAASSRARRAPAPMTSTPRSRAASASARSEVATTKRWSRRSSSSSRIRSSAASRPVRLG